MEQVLIKDNKQSKGLISGILVSIISVIMALTISYTTPVIGINSGTHIIAKADDSKPNTAEEAYKKLQGAKGGVLGDEVQNKVTNLGSDAQSLVLSIVMIILSVTTLWTGTKFTGAGDNPQAKAKLKSALAGQFGGIAFVASYSGLILFGLENLNLFA